MAAAAPWPRAATPTAQSWSRRAWWFALALLVVNDHFLKRAGIAPGWLTGKLSDFAGLVVAPVLCARIFAARSTRARAAAFGLVVGPFCAVKISAAAAHAMEAAVGCLGIRWRLWCDPTDLAALAMLPLAWWVSWAGSARASLEPRTRRALATIAGGVACLATSYAPIGVRTAAYLMNATVEPLEVQVYRVGGPLDCTSVDTLQASALASAFDPAICAEVGPGRVLPIARSLVDLSDIFRDASPPAPDPPCDAVIVRARDLPDTLLVWQALQDVDIEGNESYPAGVPGHLDPHAIYVERAGDRLFAVGSPLITASTSPISLPPMSCASFPVDAGDAGP